MGRWANGSICGWVVLWGQVGLCVRVPKGIRRSALSVDFAHGVGVDSDALAKCASSPWNHVVKFARFVDPAKRRRLMGKGQPWPQMPFLGRQRFQSMQVDFDGIARRFRLEGELGHGAYGKVYLAMDKASSEQVAAKLVTSEEGLVNGSELYLLKQGQGHPNIVRLHDGASNPYWLVLIMELGRGSLHYYIQNKRGPSGGMSPPPDLPRLENSRVPRSFALAIAQQIASGLQHLHEQGVIHRDVHTNNILFKDNATVMLSDLGLSMFVGEGCDAYEAKSRKGNVTAAGTRAPEVWLAEGHRFDRNLRWCGAPHAKYSASIDVWAWAIIALQMSNAPRNPVNQGRNDQEMLNDLRP